MFSLFNSNRGLAGIYSLSHRHALMGDGLAGRPPCLPHSRVLMEAGLAGRPPCLPHSQVLMEAGLAGRPPCRHTVLPGLLSNIEHTIYMSI